MVIGVLKEIKGNEYRVAAVPATCMRSCVTVTPCTWKPAPA